MEILDIHSRKYKVASDVQREEVKKKIEKLRKDSEKMVKGIFEFTDAQGGWFEFDYRFLPGEPIRKVKIVHNELVTIPLILARHLNNVYRRIRMLPENLDKGGFKVIKNSRCKFVPMDFYEDLKEFSAVS